MTTAEKLLNLMMLVIVIGLAVLYYINISEALAMPAFEGFNAATSHVHHK